MVLQKASDTVSLALHDSAIRNVHIARDVKFFCKTNHEQEEFALKN